ncbi:MANSC domain-containing protein 1 isoform X3 [Hippocampus zosterae]|uniref:MANSC domain-containing protein 1 isoform X3 n=1 Tax=Hippocampus zosterae TaxID=109293 RepID=UPI00223CA5DF|nr:MANSC domain-containing protein 1 isoform X3 [Hippocampus zosterae]
MTRPLAPVALALALTLAHVRSQPERCFSRQHQNAAVNARAALAAAGVAAASRSVPAEQDCVLACCSRQVTPGAKCNVAVFNGNKRNAGEDNCFLYHCPNERDCPLTKAPPGTRTYDIFKGAVHPSTARPVATTTVGGHSTAAGPSGRTPVPPAATPPATERADEMPKKQSKTKSPKESFKSEEAGPTTADKLPESTAPPSTAPAVGTPPPTTTTPPTTSTSTTTSTTTTTAVTTTPPAATSSPPPPPTPTRTTPPPPSTATPPSASATPPPPRTAIPPTAMASASPPVTATTPPSSCMTATTPLTFGSGRSQTSEVPAGGRNPGGPLSAGPGALKSGAVALLVAAVAALTLALALGGRKAMESFDRRHYTRLELNDLHYDL